MSKRSYLHNNLLINLENTNKHIFAYEITYNTRHNISNCCNPYCKKYIEIKEFFLFDGYYCSNKCREYVYSKLSNEWYNNY